jgi:tetratricopeptide (TPR) repeat protein
MVFIAGWTLPAQEISVSWLDGKASQEIASSWQELSIGDVVPSDSTVRLETHAYIELSAASMRITLSQPGTYSVRKLLSTSLTLRSAGVGKALTEKLSKFVSGPSRSQGSAGGARAEMASKAESQEWIASETEEFLEAGRDFIGSGQYDKAVEQLNKAVEAATDDERAQARYYLAEAYALGGETRSAMAQLARVPLDDSAAWAPDYVLLKGKILVDVSAFDQAVQWLLKNGDKVTSHAERMPTYFFLLGLAYAGVGDTVKEKECLRHVVAIAGESELGNAAGKLLEGL